MKKYGNGTNLSEVGEEGSYWVFVSGVTATNNFCSHMVWVAAGGKGWGESTPRGQTDNKQQSTYP